VPTDRPAAMRGSPRPGLALLGIVAIATVLRPLVVTVGPVLPEVQAELGLSAAAAALLTALPVACFGVGAFVGPALSRRAGVDTGLSLAMVLLVVGAVIRALGGVNVLFLGTVVIGASIAVANVLLPALVRRDFPERVGVITGTYTSTLAITATLAALLAVPLADSTGGGWRSPFLVWAGAAAAALVPWAIRRRRSPVHDRATAADSSSPSHLVRNPAARALTLFMGLQSIGYYVALAWLPSLLQDSGVTPVGSGALLSLVTVLGIPAGLVLPILAARMHQQRALAAGATAFTLLGWTGLLVAPAAAPVVWALLLGIGTGSTFPLALVLIGLRSGSAEITPALSALVQGVGYLIAASGPLLIGLLHDASAGWTLPLCLLIAITIAQALSGWSAGRARSI